MSIPCNICTELLQASDDARATPCGHLFHSYCITLWLLRSESCPYCRNRVTQSEIRRIYLGISNDDIVEMDPRVLTHIIKIKQFQISSRDTEINSLKIQVNQLKKELTDLKEQPSSKDEALSIIDIRCEKTKAKFDRCLDQYIKEVHSVEEQLTRCKRENMELKKEVERLTRGSYEEAVFRQKKTEKTDINGTINETTEDSPDLDSIITLD